MASWMVHLRVADKIMDNRPELDETQFVVGNIAPDCGEPNADWTAFLPPKTVTHFSSDGSLERVRPEDFKAKYLDGCAVEKRSFYLGYYCHLLTDSLWSREIGQLTRDRYSAQLKADRGFWNTIKEDWYDLDHLFLRDAPEFRAFRIFSNVGHFENAYLDFFSPTAIDRQMGFITQFYSHTDHDLDRRFVYLTKEKMDSFVKNAAATINNILS